MDVVMLGVSKKLWSSATSFMSPLVVVTVAPPAICLESRTDLLL